METVHILSAALLLGGGLAIAVFMRGARRARTGAEGAAIIGGANRAEMLLVVPAAVVQPATGIHLASTHDFAIFGDWVGLSFLLYLIGVLAWIYGLRLSFGMKALAEAAGTGALPEELRRKAGLWQGMRGIWLLMLLAVLYMMVNVRAL